MEEEKDFLLKRYEYTLKNFTDSNQAMIDFSKMALRGTMLLNGALYIQRLNIYTLVPLFSVSEHFFRLAQHL